MSAALDAFLARHGIVVPRHEHPAVMTVEESERLVPPLPGAKTKNLFLRDRKGARHFLVTVPHDVAVDLAALGIALDAGRLGFASPDRLARHLHITPGSVSLLALCNDADGAVEFVIDRALWDAPAVQAHPLVNTATMIVSHTDLERFLAATGHAPRIVDVPRASPR
ncbi:MAG TPA: prolyl-tRNA synthetase associated domain-containing protein [Casimicrobiaceae bacterium]|nr:prolyl-tRNA synthetase associated domain-containing protein [Casimicrobiaceae bacterium]